jgi:hypothetical protein
MRSTPQNDLMGKGHIFKGPAFPKGKRSRYNQLSNYCTTVSARDGWQIVTYRETQIVRWNDSTIELNFGGYDTVTTRRKMNQASNQFELGYSVFRSKGVTMLSAWPNSKPQEFHEPEQVIMRAPKN